MAPPPRSGQEDATQGSDGGPRPNIEPRFLTLDDVATYLSVSTTQVYALVRSGDLPAIKVGGRGVWRVDREQLDAYIERMHEETQEWAKKHPLNPKSKG